MALPRAIQLGLCLCHTCKLVCKAPPVNSHASNCPRCGTPLHLRKPNAMGRAWALLLAAMVLYIPANYLPVMKTQFLGRGSDSTILSGIIEFWRHGEYGIAVIIFVASVAVPCLKFIVMTFLLVTTKLRKAWCNNDRIRLYRLVEIIGYWSMLDVFVVAIVAALVSFKALGDIEPRIGIFFFGLVVVLTMLCAQSFDPRLIWDGSRE